jgi:phospholipid/cholesterol/gamma-HCH transport system permease protein
MPSTTVERSGRSVVVRLHGDIVVPTAGALYHRLRAVARRRDVRTVVVDFSGARRVDSAGIAVISLVGRQLERSGKRLDLQELDDRHRAAFELLSHKAESPDEPALDPPGALEVVGDRVLGVASGARALAELTAEVARQAVAVAVRTRRLPAGALARQVSQMGVDGLFIVGLLSFLLGMTTAFQGAVQLQKFGAGPFVADMIGLSMVRELAPLMTAIILTGRTGAAIAAELGTMKVRSEIDAMATMGINPVRFLVLPRLAAITFVGPALTLMAMFFGMAGGLVVALLTLDMSMAAFWARLAERVDLMDYAHGLGKSLVFAWIIGLAGCHLGMRAGGDASSVGHATTRTVVTSIFFIILVDAVFATISTVLGRS